MLGMVQIVKPQTRMMEVYMTDAGDQQMKVQLRALDESLAESGRLHKLTELAVIDPGMVYLFAAPAQCQQLANSRCVPAERPQQTYIHYICYWCGLCVVLKRSI